MSNNLPEDFVKTRVYDWCEFVQSYTNCENLIDMFSEEDLNNAMNMLQEERNQLASEYKNGDPLCYPPDWYDRYVFPFDMAISNLEDYLKELNGDDNDNSDHDYIFN